MCRRSTLKEESTLHWELAEGWDFIEDLIGNCLHFPLFRTILEFASGASDSLFNQTTLDGLGSEDSAGHVLEDFTPELSVLNDSLRLLNS